MATCATRLCLHCGERPSNRPRGLCWHCYTRRSVRARHQHIKPRAVVRMAQDEREPLPAAPTQELPGTKEKLAVLAQRLWNGESLWHPQDRTCLA